MRRGLLGTGVAVSALLVSVVAVPAAGAAPGWTAPANFSLPASAVPSATALAFQTGGIETIAYLQLLSASPTDVETILHAGVIPPGGTYQEQLSVPWTSSSVPAGVSLAVAPDGAAVLEWDALTGTDAQTSPASYLASYRAAGGDAWSTPVTVASDSSVNTNNIATQIVTAISADGTAAAGAQHIDDTIPNPGGARIDVGVFSPAGAWSGPTELGEPGQKQSADELALGFDGNGNLTAAFRLPVGVRHLLADQRRSASNGVWGPVEDVTPNDPTKDVTSSPQLGVAPDGSAVIAFQYETSPSSADAFAVTRSGQAGAWTAPGDVAPGGADSVPLAAGVSPGDRAYVLYSFSGTSSGDDCVGVVEATAGSSFSTPRCVSATNFAGGARGGVAFLGSDAYFAWSGGTPGSGMPQIPEASRWLDGASSPDSFTALDSATAGLGFDQLVPDEDGSVAAFWTVPASTTQTLRAAAFDAGGPNLVSASVPGSAIAGQPVTMSASFADLWSAVAGGGPSWSFGDGAGGSGGSVSHTYAAPGTYTISVSATDTLGNATTAAYTIMVAPPASTSTTTTTTTTSSPSPSPSPTQSRPVSLTGFAQSHARWRRAAGHGATGKHRPPVGTAFRFSLSVAATVALTFTHTTKGHKVSGKCRLKGKHPKSARSCSVRRTVGTLTISGAAGSNVVKFDAKLDHRHRLAAGTYTVVASARTATGKSTSKPLRFTIVS